MSRRRSPPTRSPPTRSSHPDPELLARLPSPPGLCARCRHLELLPTERSAFVRCSLADRDPDFPRYPRLPVLSCRGFRRIDDE